MRPFGFFCLALGLLLLPVPLPGQSVNIMRPEETTVQKHASPEDIRDHASNAQLQKDAKELAELCTSISADMDGLKQGLLQKDLLDKLKRVEKLSKHVREELARNSTSP
jgi:hypothetical protein